MVPLLVDNKARKVVVDSMRICTYLDQADSDSASLFPAGEPTVIHQAEIVDTMPHLGILYGFHPDDDRRPDFIKDVMADVHDVKCQSLQRFVDDNADDPALVAAYTSKIAKEQAGKALAFDAQRQRSIRNTVQDLLRGLQETLAKSVGPWVCGKDFTFGDIAWGISLYRMHWLGLAPLWADMPEISAYETRICARPSIREQVIDYPSPMPPSPHTADLR